MSRFIFFFFPPFFYPFDIVSAFKNTVTSITTNKNHRGEICELFYEIFFVRTKNSNIPAMYHVTKIYCLYSEILYIYYYF